MDQDIKSIILLEDSFIDMNLVFEDPLDIDKESLTILANPTTKITSSGTCKLDDTTNMASKKNTRNKSKNRMKKQNNKVGRKSMRKKSSAKKLDLSN